MLQWEEGEKGEKKRERERGREGRREHRALRQRGYIEESSAYASLKL